MKYLEPSLLAKCLKQQCMICFVNLPNHATLRNSSRILEPSMQQRKSIFNRFVFLSIVSTFATSSAYSHGPRYTHLATSAYLAEDPNHNWTVEEIASGRYDDAFQTIDEPIPNLNFTTSTYWVRLRLTNAKNSESDFYLEVARPLTNVINLYRERNEKAQLLFKAGDELPFADRPVVYRKFVFPIKLAPNDTLDLLIQLRSDGEVISLPIKLWDQQNFNGFVQRENLTLGLYYGLLIFVVELFLFFAFVVKQRIYTYYVGYVVFLFFMQASLDGLAFEYLWPENPWIANHSILFFSAGSVFTIMLYAAEFLRISQMPKWYRITYRSLLAVVFVCIITSLSSGIAYELTFPIINGMSLISLLLILLGIGWNQKVNKNVNVFFALGFISVLIGGIVFILTNFNLLYSDFLSQNAIKLGSAAEVTFLSLAMVGRYRYIQREKEQAQKEAFENLEKLNALTREQNALLEQQVQERTAEIEEKSEELAVKNKEIIDSITYAKRIQQAILPSDQVIQHELPNSFVLYLPKDIVAGDFYWFEAVGDVVYFAAADCTGHGVPGAMVSVVCSNALNRSVREYGLTDPGKILDKCRELVIEEFAKSEEDVKDGIDISLCALNTTTNQLQWAGAYNPLWIIRNGSTEIEEYKADKQPIGKHLTPAPFATHNISLNKGDTLYLFSDGFSDQFGGDNGKKYKSANFKKRLSEIAQQAMENQKATLTQEFKAWRGEMEQLDDVCVIGVRV